MIVKEARASESSHWYDKDGAPQYTVVGKNGQNRATTLRDARVKNLVPSVTTIIGSANKPFLQYWLQEQVLLAALTLPKKPNESDSDYCKRIIEDSKQQSRSAADAGTDIHAAIESHYAGQPTGKHIEHVSAVANALQTHFGTSQWVAERSFAHELGFGGKVDLHATNLVVDIKSKEFTDPTTVSGFDEHLMQLAAYRVGLGMPEAECGNIFVSRNVPGLVAVVKWTQEDLSRGWNMFYHLLQFWQTKNKYIP